MDLSSSSKRLSRIANFIIIICASLFCAIQIQSTLLTYFKFASITRTIYTKPGIQETMSLSICISYSDIVDYNSFPNLKKISKLPRHERQGVVQDMITIRELFDSTPSNESLITVCGLRFKSSRVFTVSRNKTDCHDLFKVQKYYTQEFMCYMVNPIQVNVTLLSYTEAIDFARGLYLININETISSKIQYIKLIIHDRGFPVWSKRYSPTRFNPHCNKTEYKVGYTRHFVSYLGYPYDPFRCITKWEGDGQCRDKCLIKNFAERFNRVPYEINTDMKFDRMHMSKQMVSDPHVANIADHISEKCRKICIFWNCRNQYSLTSYDTEIWGAMTIVVETEVSPSLLIQYDPATNLLDLLVYVMGAISAWFGFSFINSRELVQIIHRKCCKHSQITLSPEQRFHMRHRAIHQCNYRYPRS